MGAPMNEVEVGWIAVDWGTSNLRAWAMTETGEVLAARDSDRGMGRISPADYPAVLAEITHGWKPRRPGPRTVLICGMAGARQGWREAPYQPVPCPPLGSELARPDDAPEGYAVHILPGLCQKAPDDVMRGEETQIAGALACEPGFEGTICLPGTHCKWAAVEGGRVTGFQSFMTGELFELIGTRSVLRHGLAGAGSDPAAFDAAFAEALAATVADATRLPAGLFGIRAAGLLSGLTPDVAAGRLSGLLIGAELAACRPRWADRPTLLVGMGRLCDLYSAALTLAGAPAPKCLHATEATLAGLRAAYAQLEDFR